MFGARQAAEQGFIPVQQRCRGPRESRLVSLACGLSVCRVDLVADRPLAPSEVCLEPWPLLERTWSPIPGYAHLVPRELAFVQRVFDLWAFGLAFFILLPILGSARLPSSPEPLSPRPLACA